MVSEEKQAVIDAVIARLMCDFNEGDFTVLEELLGFLPINTLIESLPEDQWSKFRTNDTIVVDKSFKELRIEDEFQRALSGVRLMAKKGFDDFTLTINGDYGEVSTICDRLEFFGVKVCERGFVHTGFGSSAYGNIHFKLINK